MITIDWEWEDGVLSFPLPANCAVTRLAPSFPPPLKPAELRESMTRDLRSLAEPLRAARQIAVLVEDHSRPTRTGPLVAQLFQEIGALRPGQNPPELIIAAGAHSGKPSGTELIRKTGGPEQAYHWHDATDAGELVRVGTGSTGRPFWVNRRVAAADLRLALGTVNIHPMAGFSGGSKILLPGVAGLETIEALHALPAGCPGQGDAPLRRMMDELLTFIPIRFAWQLLSRPDGAIYGCYGGPLAEAQRRAEAALLSAVTVTAPGAAPADLILAGCRPFQLNLLGAFKALALLDRLPHSGSGLVLFNEARDGRGEHFWRNQPAVVAAQRDHYARIYANSRVAVYSPGSKPRDFTELFPDGFRLLRTFPELLDFLASLQPRSAICLPYAPVTLLTDRTGAPAGRKAPDTH